MRLVIREAAAEFSNPVVLYVHVLHLTDIERVRGDILHLTNLTVRAFGTADAIAEQAAYMEARR